SSQVSPRKMAKEGTTGKVLKEKKEKASPVEKKSGKKEKDPNAPKRPLSAYMFYSQDKRTQVKEDNPDASFGELGKILGAQWKDLDESEKKQYNDMATRDKERYTNAKAAYEGKAE
ncbi:uncharacterized protein L969DRAFT_42644, partial [Mixia osmundae IAM 14324]